MKQFYLLAFLSAIFLFSCVDKPSLTWQLEDFDLYQSQVDFETRHTDAYEGPITIVTTDYEYVIVKGDQEDTEIPYALVPNSDEGLEPAIVTFEHAQLIRDEYGNVLLQNSNKPEAWLFLIADEKLPVRIASDVKVHTIDIRTSATSTALPRDANYIVTMPTVFKDKALKLNLISQTGTDGELVARGAVPDDYIRYLAECTCRGIFEPAEDCSSGGHRADSCSTGSGDDSCSVSCSSGYACCKN